MTGPETASERSPAALVKELTRSEKLSLVHGTAPGPGERAISIGGYLPPIDRLDIPPLRFADGPLGVRSGQSTAYPASVALGAAFDPSLAREFGEGVGTEARESGIDVLLAPGCNLIRVPHCGRIFEYVSEDPFHAGRITSAIVAGIQSRGVVATPKHYVANNQEWNRVDVSATVSERTLRELYLRPFEMAVTDGDAGAIMAAYNRVNGTPMTQHRRLLSDVLKEAFGFDGPVMSDWWAVEDGPASAAAGLDLEMPGVGIAHMALMALDAPAFLYPLVESWPDALRSRRLLATIVGQLSERGGSPIPRHAEFERELPAAIAPGTGPATTLEEDTVTEARLDDMATRVLRLHDRTGALTGSTAAGTPATDASISSKPAESIDTRHLARTIATRGSVLLQNDGVLPLDPGTSLAVVGPNVHEAKIGGGGSSAVSPERYVSPVEGIRERATGLVRVERGHPPIDDSSLLDAFGSDPRASTATLDRQAVSGTVAAVETAIVVVQDNASESRDRKSLELPGKQDQLVETVATSADQTVVVLQTGGPVEMPWLDAVDAVLEMWYPGQEAGHALAALLFGDAEPGGRLPMTFGTPADYPATAPSAYPGVETDEGYPAATYGEGVFVGYRHVDSADIDPLFPFGHGRSYTTYEYESLDVDREGELTCSVRLTNTGERRGREVMQAYIAPPPAFRGDASTIRVQETSSNSRTTDSPVRPDHELAGFSSVELDVGETQTITLDLDPRAFARYDEAEAAWVVDPGEYTLEVGRSSRDIRLQESINRTGGPL